MGRSIITATAKDYWPSTYIQLKMIQRAGCQLPIYLYYPPDENPPSFILDQPFVIPRTHDVPGFGWWQRTHMLMNCGLKEALVIGADVYPISDPTDCFDDLDKGDGAIFWREIPPGSIFEPHIFDLPEETATTTFSVQGDTLILDIPKVMKGIKLCHWFNLRHEYYYPFAHSDQGCWRAAWALLGWKQYSYSEECVDWSRHYIYLHQGRDGKTPLFVHRTGAKFAMDKRTFPLCPQRIDSTPLESTAWELFDEFCERYARETEVNSLGVSFHREDSQGLCKQTTDSV